MKNLLIFALLALSANSKAAYREAECMAQAMFAEARGQGQQGILAVAHVVKTRMRIEQKSSCSVTRKGQFVRARLPARLRGMYLQTALDVLLDKTIDPTNGATHFFRRGSKTPFWYDESRSLIIGDHVFVNVAAYATNQ